MLDLGDNKLTGEIPTGLGDFSNLYWLILGGNNLSGEIPAELGNLTELQLLDLGPNQLTGEIPGWLGDLTKLRALLLRGTHLTGEIPEELGSLTNLETLYLSDNRLTGEIPDFELGTLANLRWLWISPVTSCVVMHPRAWLGDVGSNDLEQLGLRILRAMRLSRAPAPAGARCLTRPTTPDSWPTARQLLASRDTLAGTATL